VQADVADRVPILVFQFERLYLAEDRWRRRERARKRATEWKAEKGAHKE
jgi:hypothetical protein